MITCLVLARTALVVQIKLDKLFFYHFNKLPLQSLPLPPRFIIVLVYNVHPTETLKYYGELYLTFRWECAFSTNIIGTPASPVRRAAPN